MRGLGKGQQVHVILTEEISRKVEELDKCVRQSRAGALRLASKLGRGAVRLGTKVGKWVSSPMESLARLQPADTVHRAPEPAAVLAWLADNALRHEAAQHAAHRRQTLDAMWRGAAWREMVAVFEGPAARETGDPKHKDKAVAEAENRAALKSHEWWNNHMNPLLSTYKSSQNFVPGDTIPLSTSLAHILRGVARGKKDFLQVRPELRKQVESMIRMEARGGGILKRAGLGLDAEVEPNTVTVCAHATLDSRAPQNLIGGRNC